MNVVFRVVGVVIVEDVSNVLDIFNRVSIQQTKQSKTIPIVVVGQYLCICKTLGMALCIETKSQKILVQGMAT